MSNLSTLPLEVVSFIIQHLDTSSVQNIRLANRHLSAAALPFLIRRVWISSNQDDLDRLEAISEHEVLRKYVTELIWDGTSFDGRLLDQNAYMEAFRGRVSHGKQLLPVTEDQKQFPIAAVLRGHAEFKKNLHQERRVQRFGGEYLTQGRLSAQLSSRIKDVPNSYQSAERKEEWRVNPGLQRLLGPDLIILLEALVRMPRVGCVGLCNDRWTHNTRLGFRTFTILSKGKKGREKILIDPDPRIDDVNTTWLRGFQVLTQAISHLRLPQLTSFYAATHTEKNCSAEGFPCNLVSLYGTNLECASNAFRCFTRVELLVDVRNRGSHHSYTKKEDQMLELLLRCSRKLKHLHLSFKEHGDAVVTKLFRDQTWPELDTLWLDLMVLDEDDMLSFIGRHRNSLKTVFFHDVIVADAGFCPVKGTWWTLPRDRRLLSSMQSIGLEEFGINNRYTYHLTGLHRDFHSKDTNLIDCYLNLVGFEFFG